MKTFLLLCGLAGAAGSMYATPILYTFSFTGGSPNPSGSFDYDSSTNTFSNVTLTWDGVQQPSDHWVATFNQATPNFCGLSGPPAIFQGLTQGACGGVTWNASTLAGNAGQEMFELSFTLNGNPGFNGLALAASSAPLISTSGAVSAAAVAPEPGSVGLCLAGAALLAWKRGRREKSLGVVRR